MKIGEGIGERVARYRKDRGLSAERLSRATGGSLSRSVIVNIESGRKKADVSVAEVALLAAALGVPPVALILPIDRPFARVDIDGEWMPTVLEAINWFSSVREPAFSDGYAGSTDPARGQGPASILHWLREYQRAVADAQGAATLGAQGVMWLGRGDGSEAPSLEGAQRRLAHARYELEARGVSFDPNDTTGAVPKVPYPDTPYG